MAVYSTILSGLSKTENAQIGLIAQDVIMVMEHESDLLAKKSGPRDWLFNTVKSKTKYQAIVEQYGFDSMTPVEEGGRAENFSAGELRKKVLENIWFLNQFSITQIMMDDANYGLAGEAEKRAKNFMRSFYKTQHEIAQYALINATSTSYKYKNTTGTLDLTTADGFQLFYDAHLYGAEGDTQSNAYYTARASGASLDASDIESALAAISVKMRGLKGNDGTPLGYIADTVIIPGNRPSLETYVRQALGSVNTNDSANNNINTQYNNWNLVILPLWQSSKDEIYIMSKDANEALEGNIFLDRKPLTVRNTVDPHTLNLDVTGSARFGVGFGSYKHIMRWESVAYGSTVSNSTAIVL